MNTLTLFLIGMILFRLALFERPAAHQRAIVVLISFGAASWAAAEWLLPEARDLGSPLLLRLAAAQATAGLGLIREMWLAFAYIGIVLLLIARNPAWIRRLSAFGWTGRMALTNYLVQIAILDVVFSNYALGLRIKPLASFGAATTLFIIDAAISRWWLLRFYFGPFEWLWRSLAYRQRQPFVRESASVLHASVG